MDWSPDVSAGAWLAARLDDRRGTMHTVVPRGFATYTRVFHPATRDRPVEGMWPPAGASDRRWRDFLAARPEIDVQTATWGETARSLGTTMHPTAQWHALVEDADDPRDRAGWRWSAPAEGRLDADLVAALGEDLTTSTTTPDDVFVAVWDGWGGLIGALGYGDSRATYSEDDTARHHAAMIARSIPTPLGYGYIAPTWQPGVLSDEISRGPRLRLPDRDHVLFHGRLAELAEPMPWAEDDDPFAPSPSLVWPADHAWVVVTEVDLDSTIVAGPASVAAVLADDPRLETAQIDRDADLAWDADGVNRGSR